jgi:ribosomal protein S18 acetylase RimI-like enzyme
METRPIHLTRPSTAADLAWIAPLLAASPEAAQWLPESDPVLVVEGCGVLVYRAVAPDEYEILNLAVAPEHRRQGVARALLEAALAQGGSWFLEVRESNHLAQIFYESMGFRAIGVRPGYYQAPPEKAIVMGLKR